MNRLLKLKKQSETVTLTIKDEQLEFEIFPLETHDSLHLLKYIPALYTNAINGETPSLESDEEIEQMAKLIEMFTKLIVKCVRYKSEDGELYEFVEVEREKNDVTPGVLGLRGILELGHAVLRVSDFFSLEPTSG